MFHAFCWGLNVVRLSWLAQALRWLVWQGYCAAVPAPDGPVMGRYDNPAAVGGWQGWYRVPWFGVVAFVDLDDRLHFRW